jgi:hypothetical protein
MEDLLCSSTHRPEILGSGAPGRTTSLAVDNSYNYVHAQDTDNRKGVRRRKGHETELPFGAT